MAGETSGAVSSASTALSTRAAERLPGVPPLTALVARPARVRRETCTSTAGSPSASSTPCSPDGEREGQVGELPERARRARDRTPELVRDRVGDRALQSSSGAEPKPSEYGHHERLAHGSRRRGRRARSPRRTARCPPLSERRRSASRATRPRRRRRRCRRWSRRARSCAWSRARRTRARARAARPCPTVRPPSHAPPRRGGRGSRSAWRCVEPGRWATTVFSVPLAVDRLRLRSGACAPRSPRRRCRRALQRLRDVLGERVVAGAARAPVRETPRRGSAVRANARAPSNASGASVEVRGSGRAAQRERGDRQREQERQEGRTVEAPVEHRLDHS